MLEKHWQRSQSVGKFADVFLTLPTDGQHWPRLACLLGACIRKRKTSELVDNYKEILIFETDEIGPSKSMLIRSKDCAALIRIRLSFGFKNEAFTSQQSLQARVTCFTLFNERG